MNPLDLYLYETQKIYFIEKDFFQMSKLLNQIEKLKIQLMQDTKMMDALSFQTKTPYVQFVMSKKILPSVQTNFFNQLTEFGGSPPVGELLVTTSAVGTSEDVVTANAAADNKEDTSLPPM